MLRDAGMQITSEEPAQAGITNIIDHTGKPYTIKLIMEKLGLTNVRVQQKLDPAAAVDLEVTVGADYQGK